jgi:hypothetical protein
MQKFLIVFGEHLMSRDIPPTKEKASYAYSLSHIVPPTLME